MDEARSRRKLYDREAEKVRERDAARLCEEMLDMARVYKACDEWFLRSHAIDAVHRIRYEEALLDRLLVCKVRRVMAT